jgi:hypothetical protein
LEHSAQVALSLAALLGVIRLVDAGDAPRWWLLCLAAQPLIRFEGCAVLLAGVAVLIGRRRWAAASAVATAGAVLVALFSLYLHGLGLPALPSSVLAKSSLADAGVALSPGLVVARIGDNLLANLASPGGVPLAIPTLWLLWRRFSRTADAALRPVAGFAAAIGLAQLFCGNIAPFSRYEIYALVTLLAAVFVCEGRDPVLHCRRWTRAQWLGAALAALLLLGPYANLSLHTAAAANNIYLQQYQMHRFATGFYAAPVAVNDLGWVSYGNPNYVLDLKGLGSETARRAAAGATDGLWMETLARQKRVGLAMLYEGWFAHLPPGWRPLAYLTLEREQISVAFTRVSFFATGADTVDDTILAALRRFGGTLPPGATLELAGPAN